MLRNPKASKSIKNGFTLIEILVAMVILAFALLGMAAMSVLVMKGTRGASDINAATNLCQSKIEELKEVMFTELGSKEIGTDTAVDLQQFGATQGDIIVETNLDSQGQTDANPQPKHKFTRSFVICKGQDYGSGGIFPMSAGDYVASPVITDAHCSVKEGDNGGTPRPVQLACLDMDILGTVNDAGVDDEPGDRESKIKVLCTWRSRSGQCHGVSFDTTSVSLQ